MTNGPSAKAEMAERRAVITADQQSKLRPSDSAPSTMHAMSRLSNDLEGRQSARDYLSGSDVATDYPFISAGPWSSDYAKVPDEPPLGYAIDAQEAVGTFAEISLSAAVVADKAEVVAPLVATPSANVEHASATSFAGASAEETKTPKERVEQPTTHSARLLHSTRPRRRL